MKEKNDLITKNRNTVIENISLSKDINGIVKFVNTELLEKPDLLTSQINLASDVNKKAIENKDNLASNINSSESASSQASNLEKTRKDFSSLLILMRKATRLINVFDNKVKIVANKLQQ